MILPFILCTWLGAEKFPCGPFGFTAEVEAGSGDVTVVALDPESPAATSGVRIGDHLIALDRIPFSHHDASVDSGGNGPQRTLGNGIDDALARGEPFLRVGLRRGDETLEVELPLEAQPPLTTPEGRLALRRAAATQLLAAARPQGFWDAPVGLTGDRVTTAWAVIALLAHGDSAHDDAIERAATWLHGPDQTGWLPDDYGKGPDNLGNWALASSLIALAEHALATATSAHQPLLEHFGKGLAERLDAEGRFGHDVTVGYGGKGFNVINTLSHAGWALAEAAGVPRDADAWRRSFAQIEQSIDANDGVRYWTLPGTGTADASLRTGSMALALTVTGEQRPLRNRLVQYLDRNAPRTREAHAVGSLGMLVAAPALRAVDHEAYARFLEEWRWYFRLMWGPGDRVRYIGGKGNNGGDSYLGFDMMACIIALQVLAAEDGRLRMHGTQAKR